MAIYWGGEKGPGVEGWGLFHDPDSLKTCP
jgi:hypothetical protein